LAVIGQFESWSSEELWRHGPWCVRARVDMKLGYATCRTLVNMHKVQCCLERTLCKLCSTIKIPLTSLSFVVNKLNALMYTTGAHMSKWANLPGGISVIHCKQWLLSSR